MSRDRESVDRSNAVDRTGDFFDRLERELARPAPAPDLTRSIMGRLGYMQVPERVMRRRRWRQRGRRTLMCAAALAALGAGLVAHERSSSARRPRELSIPAALGRDVSHHRQNLDSMFRGIRELAPPAGPDRADSPESMPVVAPTDGPAEPPRGPLHLEADIDQSAVGPVRWL